MSTPKIVLGTMTFGFDKAQTPKALALEMMQIFQESQKDGIPEYDSARMYGNGDTEKVLGEIIKENPGLGRPHCSYSTKANAFPTHNKTLTAESVKGQCQETIDAFGFSPIDIFYLHGPDIKTDIAESLKAVQELYEEGKFKEFGLSNFTAWETAIIHAEMTAKKWVVPTVYQGMYNAIARRVEVELFPCLRRLNMRFYAYNPLAGGVLSGKYLTVQEKTEEGKAHEINDGRFNKNSIWGQIYQDRFMKNEQIAAVATLRAPCESAGVTMVQASLRWMLHHSQLKGECGDRLIVGASKLNHFTANMAALTQGPLPDELVKAFEELWVKAAPVCPEWSRGYSGSAL